MKKILRTVFFCVLGFNATKDISAQILRRPLAAAYTGFSAYSKDHADVFSFTSNQAALARQKNSEAGVYGERRFLLSELSHYLGVMALPAPGGNFGIKASYSGFSDYHESQVGLAYGKKLGSNIDLGLQFNYNTIRVTGYGSASAFSFEAGTIMHITERIHAGMQVNNPVGGKFFKTKKEKLPSVYSFGLGYDASEKFLLSTIIEKEEDQPVNVNAGIQYKFIPQMMARAGFSSATSSLWAGIGLFLKSFRLDATVGYHPQLGVTPGLLLLFNFNKRSTKKS